MSKKRDIALFVLDAIVAIKKIEEYTESFNNPQELRYSYLHWDATIKELEIIGESIKHLLNHPYISQKSPNYFQKIVSFRNFITHEYFGIDEDEVWNIVKEKLPLLKQDLFILTKSVDLKSAIECSIIEYKKYNHQNIIDFLCRLKGENE